MKFFLPVRRIFGHLFITEIFFRVFGQPFDSGSGTIDFIAALLQRFPDF